MTAVKGKGFSGLGEKGEGIKQKKKKSHLIDTDNNTVIPREKEGWGTLKKVPGE